MLEISVKNKRVHRITKTIDTSITKIRDDTIRIKQSRDGIVFPAVSSESLEIRQRDIATIEKSVYFWIDFEEITWFLILIALISASVYGLLNVEVNEELFRQTLLLIVGIVLLILLLVGLSIGKGMRITLQDGTRILIPVNRFVIKQASEFTCEQAHEELMKAFNGKPENQYIHNTITKFFP